MALSPNSTENYPVHLYFNHPGFGECFKLGNVIRSKSDIERHFESVQNNSDDVYSKFKLAGHFHTIVKIRWTNKVGEALAVGIELDWTGY